MESNAGERARWEEEYLAQQEELRALRRFISQSARTVGGYRRPSSDHEKMGFTARGERAEQAVSRNIRSAEERLRRIEADPTPRPPEPLRITPSFESHATRLGSAIEVSHLGKSYGGTQVLRDVSFTLTEASRVVLVGPNGAGKTTLLEIIAGLTQQDAGTLRRTSGVTIGYLSQNSAHMDADRTILETYRKGRIGRDEDFIADLIRYGLFSYENLSKKLSQASVGHRRKLEIARLIADGPNILLLDEPTNFLSPDVLEAFEDAILEFQGPVLVVSHDRRFIERFGGEVWEMIGGQLFRSPGRYSAEGV